MDTLPECCLEQLATDEVHERESAPLGWWRLLPVLLAVSAALVALSLFLPTLVDHELTRDRGDLRLFTYVNDEANLPTWWTVVMDDPRTMVVLRPPRDR
ncbi:MAG: hypothetical protein WKG07_40645 [Hymenobacter sp.]